jgi:hypothetical protein
MSKIYWILPGVVFAYAAISSSAIISSAANVKSSAHFNIKSFIEDASEGEMGTGEGSGGNERRVEGEGIRRLIEAFRRRRSEGSGIRRGDGQDICLISPGLLEEVNVIWSDRPLFLWLGAADHILVRDAETLEQVWSQPIDPMVAGITYDGESLQSGRTYEWQLNSSDHFFAFTVMDSDQRNQIAAELQLIQTRGGTPEEIAVGQANYLVNEVGLWSDALQILYSVENPSPSLLQARQEIIDDICLIEETPN